eukprot:CAMPEP_0173181392 /NCGR_PEP_ID=MMETSP1141-20130122/7256_1 /TAXON_ID=483371 /ORGANISM="non described non described, Strain CCMP2298" /LENGTH=38 /DNA_ID= /DNA_START= /DNA_END= /DNA_ORIENTATION=
MKQAAPSDEHEAPEASPPAPSASASSFWEWAKTSGEDG